ncbi:2-hydroxychromene-2-carboxylate isomerase [Roseibium aggregatum]|uniref:2-hydroxychromene-2-carboxylate isomerase n=1 Tax=Roseibium aggregatum TaxID=187304 RepID=A0A926S6B3_9HYPH|nr:2-hydroxychromene-2-carboxylate isomerase [Roseibium aggregatum]MBD1547045.1 2-hydroxychromene-2-carboxylate isomerase [Roseibium aggregatum]
MAVTIDYFYTHISPWAYLGHQAFRDIAARHGATVRLRPVDLSGVFDASGGLPLGKRHPTRQAYRFIEMQRWREKRALPLTLKPAFFPTPPGLCDCCAIALAEQGGPALDFTGLAFKAIWADEKNIAEEAVLGDLLSDLEQDAGTVLAAARSEDITAIYKQNQTDAIELGVIGSPCYVLNGEPFWGQDRLDLLDDALTSGRGPYKPL